MKLFIHHQKNDPYAKGTEVVIAWVTGSGVEVGVMVQRLLARLHASGLHGEEALVCPVRGGGGFRPPAKSGFRPTGALKTALKALFADC